MAERCPRGGSATAVVADQQDDREEQRRGDRDLQDDVETAGPGDAVQLGIGLLLLGLGWSCGLIAGSTLVTESVGTGLRPTAQGGTDLLMGLGAALAGVVGGPLLAVGGYGLVSAVSAVLVLPLAVVWVLTLRRPATAVSGPGSS